MASIIKIGTAWRAQVRRKGFKAITESFPTKAMAQKWATKIESEIDSKKYQDGRGLAEITLEKLIDRYIKEIGAEKTFGKNKTAVLKALKKSLGNLKLSELTDDRLTQYVRDRRAGGAGGVTINIDLTYIGTVLKTARQLWKIPVSLDPVTMARANMEHLGISTRSNERTRRPTSDEIKRLCAYFDDRSELPMRDLINFAIATAMRIGEIVGLRWDNLNKKDRTIIIKDRKHPRKKKGNDQEVPLLGNAYKIVLRQPQDGDLIFPYLAETVSTIFPRACEELGIENLHFHDFRHEGVSRLFEQGYTIERVALVSGHRDLKMLMRYVQLRAKDLHRV